MDPDLVPDPQHWLAQYQDAQGCWQELGIEKVMDEDHLLTLGMRATSISIRGQWPSF
jgi:hypothetical protein